MANNFNAPNPYTTKIPVGTLTQVNLTQPSNVQIKWPSKTGNTVPVKSGKISILKSIFG